MKTNTTTNKSAETINAQAISIAAAAESAYGSMTLKVRLFLFDGEQHESPEKKAVKWTAKKDVSQRVDALKLAVKGLNCEKSMLAIISRLMKETGVSNGKPRGRAANVIKTTQATPEQVAPSEAVINSGKYTDPTKEPEKAVEVPASPDHSLSVESAWNAVERALNNYLKVDSITRKSTLLLSIEAILNEAGRK